MKKLPGMDHFKIEKIFLDPSIPEPGRVLWSHPASGLARPSSCQTSDSRRRESTEIR